MPTAPSPTGIALLSSNRTADVELDRNYYLPALAATLLSLLLYAVTLHGTYIYDDQAIILEDARIANPSLWPKFWTTQYLPGAADNLYRPLVSMSYAVQWWLHGDVAWAFHAVNWLLAAGCAAAVAELARRLAGRPAAWVAGLLFAAHPIHVEVVAGIVGRAELACLLATFAGLCLFIRRPLSARRVAAIMICFILALGSKEQGILFPLLLAALIPFRRTHAPADAPTLITPLEVAGPVLPAIGYAPVAAPKPADRAASLWLLVGVLYVEAGYLLFRESILKFGWERNFLAWPDNPLIRSAGLNRWLMPFVLLGRYVALLVAPINLSIDYGSDVIGSAVRYHEPYVYIGFAVTLAWLAGFGLAVRRRTWGTAFVLFGLAVTFGIVSNLPALIGTIFGERLMFMPSAFLAILVGMAGASFLRRGGVGASVRWRRMAIAVPTALLLIIGSIRTVAYARLWNDRLAFYQATVETQPKSIRAYSLLYREYSQAGNWPAARAIGERCRAQAPQWWESWVLCAEPAMKMGRLDEAKALIDRAFQVCPHDALIGWYGLIEQQQAQAAPATKPSPATAPN